MPPKKSLAKETSTKKAAVSTVEKGGKKKSATADATPATAAVSAVSTATATAALTNVDIVRAFEKLSVYESHVNKWASLAYRKVLAIIIDHKKPITSSADISNKEGVGKASKEKLEELLTTGKIKKLEEHKETYGELDEAQLPLSTTLAQGGEVATVKSGGKGSKAAGAVIGVKGKKLPAATLKKIKNMESKYEALSVDNLKTILRSNKQIIGGNKPDLVQRCCEGIILGAIPLCPVCYAGKPRYDIKTGVYKCPGYTDDDEYKPCYFTGTDESFARVPWSEL
jgi:hypothetical protein